MFNFFKKKKKYNVLIIGAKGMLGSDVYRLLINNSLDDNPSINTVCGLDINDIDIANYVDLNYCLTHKLSFKPDYIINCAAFTDTVACQDNSTGTLASYRANVIGVKNLAEMCAHMNIKLIHISTDYVTSQYRTSNTHEFPINTYGLHKLLGEKYVELAFNNKPENYMILRTSWLYGSNSNKTFIHKFIRNCYNALNSDEKTVYVTNECYGRPTSTVFLSSFILKTIQLQMHGIIDAQQNALAISRYDWAEFILQQLSKKYPEYSNLKLENYIDKNNSPIAVKHPTIAAPLVNYGNSFDKYVLASSYNLNPALKKHLSANYLNGWKYHTALFLEQNLENMLNTFKNN